MSAPSSPKSPSPAAAPAPAQVAASPKSASPSPSPASTSSTSFNPSNVLADARRQWNETQSATSQQQRQAKLAWNEKIAIPTNQAIRSANVEWQKVRLEYPVALIGGTTAAVFAASLLSGRGSFRTLRNTTFAAIGSGLVVDPAATIGTLALIRERLTTAAGFSRPTTVVVQQTQPVVTPTVPAAQQKK